MARREYINPRELVKIAEARGIPIQYHPATKAFVATVQIKDEKIDLRAPTQRALEKKVLQLLEPDQRRRAMLVETFYGAKKVELIRRVGDRGWEYINEEGRIGHTRWDYPYEWDADACKTLKALVAEKDKFEKDWNARWNSVKDKLKPIPRGLLEE